MSQSLTQPDRSASKPSLSRREALRRLAQGGAGIGVSWSTVGLARAEAATPAKPTPPARAETSSAKALGAIPPLPDAALRRKGIVTYFYEYRTGRSFGSMDAYVRSHDEARVLTKERYGDTFKPYTFIPHKHMEEEAKNGLNMLDSAAAKKDMTDRVCFFMLNNPELCASPGVEIVLLKEIKAIRNAKTKTG